MINIHTHNQPFKQYSWAFFALLLLSSPLLFTNKEFLTLWLNQHHNSFLDIFFKYVTYIGNGWLLLPLFLFVLSRNYYLSLVLGISIFVESLLVQVILKNGFFADVVRPIKYIAQSDLLHRVEGVEIYNMHSFPSGHTQTAFLLFTFLALFCKRRTTAYILLFIAVLIGISRVYILQHFFIDVWFGALIGYLFLMISIVLFNRFSGISKSEKWNRGFLSPKENKSIET